MATDESSSRGSERRDPGVIVDIDSEKDLDDYVSGGGRLLLYFHAAWAGPCKQVGELFETLHASHVAAWEAHTSDSTSATTTTATTTTTTTTTTGSAPNAVQFVRVDGDKFGSVASKRGVQRVPTVQGVAAGRVVGSVQGALTQDVAKLFRALSNLTDDQLLTRACETLVQRSEIVLLTKPRCPFCARAATALRTAGVHFDAVDVAADAAVRDRVKEVAAFDSFPMVFARGRLVGGVDVVERLADERRLLAELARTSKDEPLPSIGADDENKRHEKKESEAEAEKEAKGEGEDLNKRLERLTKQDKIVLFMKGSPEAPRCGFSRRMVETLQRNEVRDFATFDILTDNEVRQGMKTFSKWPTFPQLYANGRFVGGLDVVNELVEMGELQTELDV